MKIKASTRSAVHVYAVVFVFLIIRLTLKHLLGVNEADVLPVARQFMDGSWLPEDWYLNQSIGYRVLFNFFIGILTRIFSFPVASIAGRIVLVFLWTYIFGQFIRILKIPVYFIIPLLWLVTKYQSIIAGEWMINALETKAFSYAALFAAVLFIRKRKYLLSALFLGLSVSFHVLVGGYGTMSMILFMIAERKTLKIDRFTFLKALLVYTVAASVGLYAVFGSIFSPADVNKVRAGLIYVFSRVPHHVLPSYWIHRSGLWKSVLKLVLSLAVIIPAAVKPWNGFIRILSRYALLSLVFAAAGFGLYFSGHYDLLKFYPFRFPDTILPVFAYFIFFSYISRSESFRKFNSVENIRITAGAAASIILLTGISVSFIKSAERLIRDPEYYLSYRDRGDNERVMYEWINRNTPHDSVFLIPPGEKHFFLTAERAQFVDYKHSPQVEKDILEWYSRLTMVAGEEDDGFGYKLDLEKINKAYWNLSASSIDKILKRYNIDYYIGHNRSDLPYRKVFSAGNLSLYDLNSGDADE